MSEIYLAIGSNLGDRMVALESALSEISAKVGTLVKASSIYETQAWGYRGKPYLNQVLIVRSDLAPHDLLDGVLEIELGMGRQNRSGIYEDRFIDIDILFYDDLVMISHDLVIPHPHLHERKFVLLPLVEIAPELIHPSVKLPVNELLENLKDPSPIEAVLCAIPT